MDHFHYKNGEYYAEDVSLLQLAEAVGTPFYCYSTATFTRHYQVFRDSFTGLSPAPKICFAVKANPNVGVLATLAKLGCGADVVSEGEIRLARAAGVTPDNIVFSGVGKTQAEMAYALDQNIFQFNVESEPELRALNAIALSKGVRAPIALRINPDVESGTHAKISTGSKETKFGVNIEEALALYQLAETLPGVRVRGVSVHIGSQLTSLTPFTQAFRRVRQFVDQLRENGHTIHTVDLGGGLGIPYDDEAPPLPVDYAAIARREMEGIDAQLIFEPGRMMAGNAGILVTRVIYIKCSAARTFIIVDAGMNDLIRPTLYDAYHAIVPVRLREDTPHITADVVGPVCETGDIFAENRTLPLPEPGDLLAFRSAGAYGASMASTYNARPLVAETLVNGDKWALTRPRQTYEELVGAYQLPGW